MDIADETRKAMARQLSPARRRAADRFRHFDPPLSDDVLAAGEHQDRVAETGELDSYDPDDRVLTDELPPGYDRRWEGF